MSWKRKFKKNLEEFLINFDPNQPRDELGRWTTAGGSKGSSGKADFGGEVAEFTPYWDDMIAGKPTPDMIDYQKHDKISGSKRLYENVGKFEDSIRNDKIETAAFFDDQGNMVFSKTGDKTSVQFTQEEIDNIRGDIAVMTHNHPSGGSFSDGDLGFAIRVGINEVRAVGENFTYVVQDFKNMKIPDPDMSSDAVAERVRMRWNENHRDEYNRLINLVSSGQMLPETAALTHNHNVMQSLSKEFGFKYTRLLKVSDSEYVPT